MQRSRNRRGADMRQHVDVLPHLLQPLFVAHAEALLFIDDQQAEIVIHHVLRQQPVRTDDDVDLARRRALREIALISFGDRNRLSISTRTGKGAKRRLNDLEMLQREHGRGSEHRHLLAVAERLERRAHGDFGLAETDVAAQQTVHRLFAFHVPLDLPHGLQLVLGRRVLESVFELALPVAVGGKREAFGHLALRHRASAAHPPCRASWL